MTNKIWMTITSVILLIFAIILVFLPQETSAYLGLEDHFSVFLQLLGAVYFGFGMMNWMAKGLLIGGIYGKPIAMGNFCHFAVGALGLVKIISGESNLALIVITALYVILAVGHGMIFFRSAA